MTSGREHSFGDSKRIGHGISDHILLLEYVQISITLVKIWTEKNNFAQLCSITIRAAFFIS